MLEYILLVHLRTEDQRAQITNWSSKRIVENYPKKKVVAKLHKWSVVCSKLLFFIFIYIYVYIYII
jgi:hypothetical protein